MGQIMTNTACLLSRPTAEERVQALRWWPVDFDYDRKTWRLKLSGLFLAESAESPEEAYRLGRIALAGYCQVPLEYIPKRLGHSFVSMVGNCYRKHYADDVQRTEATFWGMLEEMETLIRAHYSASNK